MQEKVQKIDEDVVELKVKINVMDEKLDTHMDKVERHISSDERIVSRVAPLLDKLDIISEIVEEYHFEKTKKQKSEAKWKKVALRVGVVGTIAGIFFGAVKAGIIVL